MLLKRGSASTAAQEVTTRAAQEGFARVAQGVTASAAQKVVRQHSSSGGDAPPALLKRGSASLKPWLTYSPHTLHYMYHTDRFA